jgi:OOP family OmpA-OmpF porin
MFSRQMKDAISPDEKYEAQQLQVEGFMLTKIWGHALVIALAGFLLTHCAQYQPAALETVDLNARLGQGYRQKVDNFLVLFDTSGSMSRDPYSNIFSRTSKLEIAKEVVGDMNHTIPNIQLTGGLRIFGPRNELLYGMEKYNPQALDAALEQISLTRDLSPLAMAMELGAEDFAGLPGKSALIVVSDGREMDRSPIQATEDIVNRFGEKICIYTVHIGNDAEGGAMLQRVANVGGCGIRVSDNDVATPEGMALFVSTVFLEKIPDDQDGDGVYDTMDKCPDTPKGVAVDANGCPLDSDGDGVPDFMDKCPDTPAGVVVDSVGCPLDSDGDGVPDFLDKCPDTPAGMAVDASGCPLPITEPVSIKLLVEFDFDKYNIRPQYHNHLRAIADYLTKNPEIKVVLEGHTDWEGTSEYNLHLSMQRAESVKNYLVSNFGVDPSRLSTKGYGETRPVAPNDTEENRQRNRRVVARFYTM